MMLVIRLMEVPTMSRPNLLHLVDHRRDNKLVQWIVRISIECIEGWGIGLVSVLSSDQSGGNEAQQMNILGVNS